VGTKCPTFVSNTGKADENAEYHRRLSSDQLRAASLIGRNAVT